MSFNTCHYKNNFYTFNRPGNEGRVYMFDRISIIFLAYYQGPHSDWKTWKIKKTFSSQGKLKFWAVREFCERLEKFLKMFEEVCVFFRLTPMLRR